MKKTRLLLIYPSHNGRRKKATIPSLTMPYLAALVPDPHNYEITIVDENVEPVPLDQPWDLAGITVMTHCARRSYELAAHLRARGTKVVLGGWHISALPQEAAPHADAVVTDEAERVWPKLLEDFRAGHLQPAYRGDKTADISHLPYPRWDLVGGAENDFTKFIPIPDGLKKTFRFLARRFPLGQYQAFPDWLAQMGVLYPLQTRRGCSVGCTFCSVKGAVRLRPFDHVLGEMSYLAERYGFRHFFVVDDNFGLFPEKTKELLRALALAIKAQADQGRTLRWFTQISVNFGEDNEMLSLMHEAGCRGVFLGIESISPDNLKAEHKMTNKPEKFQALIGNFHAHDLGTFLSFIIGLPNDQPGVGQRTAQFAHTVRAQAAGFSALHPLPGTEDFEAMKQEGTLLDGYWLMKDDARHHRAVFEHPHLSPTDIWQEVKTARETFYSYAGMAERIRSAPPSHRWPMFMFNLLFRQFSLGEHVMKDSSRLLWELMKAPSGNGHAKSEKEHDEGRIAKGENFSPSAIRPSPSPLRRLSQRD